MAEQIHRPTGVANFKPAKSARIKAKQRDTREDREGNSNAHLEAIRKCPCIVTLRVPAGEAHHLKQGTGERGAGMRSSDRWAVPLCRSAHEEIERIGSRNETAWLQARGVPSPIDLAHALWKASPDVAAMMKIILAHRVSVIAFETTGQ